MKNSTRPRAALRTLAAALILLALGASPAWATACTVSNGGLNFGTYNGSAVTVVVNVTVNCPAGTSYNVGADLGTGFFGPTTKWRMQDSNSDAAYYRLFRDAAETQYIGTSPGTNTIPGTGTGSNQTVYIYGLLVTSTAYVPSTSYTDSVGIYVFTSGPNVSSTMTTSLVVPPLCSLSISTLAFGIYTGQQLDGTANASVTCTNTTTYNIGVNVGQYGNGNYYNWNMSGPGGQILNYSLYRDSARTSLWGGTPGYDTPSGTGTGIAQTIPIYGRIPAGQYVAPGNYSDIVTFFVYY